LATGGPALDARVNWIVETLGQGPFIFNLGHGILPHTPIEHVEQLVALVKGDTV
jgi:uroporphyrinogen decarboxylase